MVNELHQDGVDLSSTGTGAILWSLGCLLWVCMFFLTILAFVHSYPYSI